VGELEEQVVDLAVAMMIEKGGKEKEISTLWRHTSISKQIRREARRRLGNGN